MPRQGDYVLNTLFTVRKELLIVLDRTKKVKSPLPEPATEFISKKELLKNLTHTRTPLLEYINEIIDESVIEDKSMIHPFFGPMSIIQINLLVFMKNVISSK